MKKINTVAQEAIQKFHKDFKQGVYYPLYYGWSAVICQKGSVKKPLPEWKPMSYEQWNAKCEYLIEAALKFYKTSSYAERFYFLDSDNMRFSVHVMGGYDGEAEVDCSLSITI